MSLEKIDTRTRVGDQAFDSIRNAIISGTYPAGTRLQINALSEELGTSMMPVREAIKRLEEIGLVENRPYRGAVVREFTGKELLNIYSIRLILETEAMRIGAEKITKAESRKLKTLHSACKKSMTKNDANLYLDTDEELLRTIYQAADNPLLVEMIDNLWARCRFYKLVGTAKEFDNARDVSDQEMDEAVNTETLALQEKIIAAIAAGDASLAATHNSTSIQLAMDRIRTRFSSEL